MIFIDANCYLRFFDTVDFSYRRLLDTLVELRDVVFVTHQIVQEVQRRKLGTAQNGLASIRKTLLFNPSENLPIHFDDGEQVAEEWNKRWKKLRETHRACIQDFDRYAHGLLEKICRSEDRVSKTLSKLFQHAKMASEETIKKAERRRLLGNPPGKKSDPLGDQLSWEQLLSEFDGSSSLWLVTTDGDYIVEYQKGRCLNAFLHQELATISAEKEVSVRVFNLLLPALDDYRKQAEKPVYAWPTEEEVKAIEAEDEVHIKRLQQLPYTYSNEFVSPVITIPPAGVPMFQQNLSFWGGTPGDAPANVCVLCGGLYPDSLVDGTGRCPKCS